MGRFETGTSAGGRGRTPRAVLAGVAVALVVVACSDSPTGPEFQVIEELDFAPSLNVDLSRMQRLGSGVYIEDLVVGGGDEVQFGLWPSITFSSWLADGSPVNVGTEETFLMGNSGVINGLEDGLLRQRVGGVRRMVIPPHRAFGGQELTDNATGEVLVPAGSVLVYEVEVREVSASQPPGG